MQQVIRKIEDELVDLITKYFPMLKNNGKAREFVEKDSLHFRVLFGESGQRILLNDKYEPVPLMGFKGLSETRLPVEELVSCMRALAVMRAIMVNNECDYSADIRMVNLGATNYLLKVLPSVWHTHVLHGRSISSYLAVNGLLWSK